MPGGRSSHRPTSLALCGLALQGPSPPWVFIFLGPVLLKEAIKALRPGPASPKDLKTSLARRNDRVCVPPKSWLQLQPWHGHRASRAELGGFHVKEADALDTGKGRGQACRVQLLVT